MDAQNTFKTGTADNNTEAKTPKYPVKDPQEIKKAADDEDIININIDDTEDSTEDEGIVTLSKSYKFDGQIIKEIDMTGLEEMGQIEAQKIDKMYKKFAKGNISVQPEITSEYAIVTAHYLTGLPLEFFNHLRRKDILKIRNCVINFLFGD